MKKSSLLEIFEKIKNAYPEYDSLIWFTEAVFICNPKPKDIKKFFYKYVKFSDYTDFEPKEILKETFGDLLNGVKTLKNERLSPGLYK